MKRGLIMSRCLKKTTPFKAWWHLEHPKAPNKPRLLSRGTRKGFLILLLVSVFLLQFVLADTAYFNDAYVNGIKICLEDGTNCQVQNISFSENDTSL